MTKKSPLADFVPKSKIRTTTGSDAEKEWMAAAGENKTLGEYAAERTASASATSAAPRSTPRPADLRKPKKIVTRATEEFHHAVKMAATAQGMSMEDMTTLALEELMARWAASDPQS